MTIYHSHGAHFPTYTRYKIQGALTKLSEMHYLSHCQLSLTITIGVMYRKQSKILWYAMWDEISSIMGSFAKCKLVFTRGP